VLIPVPPLPYLVPIVLMWAMAMVVMVFEKDLGATLLFLGIFLAMLYLATGELFYTLIGALLMLAGGFVAYHVFAHVATRVDIWIDPFAEEMRFGPAYQLVQGLFALGNGFASLDLLHWTTSGQAVLITILGGIGTLWGSLLGAVIVLELRDALTTAPEASGVVTGAVFVVIVLSFRRGLWATGRDALRRFAASPVSARIDLSEGGGPHGRS